MWAFMIELKVKISFVAPDHLNGYAHLAQSRKVKAIDILDSALNENSTIQKLYNSYGNK